MQSKNSEAGNMIGRGKRLNRIIHGRLSLVHFLSLSIVCLAIWFPVPGWATDWVRLNAENWHDYVPQGKEVDAIYGDFALRNDKIVVIIGRPTPQRNANLTIRDVGGFVLDLTLRAQQNDQLGCYFPLGGAFKFHSEKKLRVMVDGELGGLDQASGQVIQVSFESSLGPQGEKAVLTYTLEQGSPYLKINHVVNKGNSFSRLKKFVDVIRADRTFKFATHLDGKLFTANDDWFRQCYGICYPQGKVTKGKGRVGIEFKLDEKAESDSESTSRFLFPGNSLLAAIGQGRSKLGNKLSPVKFMIEEPRGKVGNSLITLSRDGKKIGTARSNNQGNCNFLLENGTYVAEVVSIGQPTQTRNFGVLNQREVRVRVKYGKNPPLVNAKIRDANGAGIPCKVAFIGIEGTATPDLGPDSAANPVGNLFYSHNGSFEQALPAGKYEVIISRGPEYDAEYLKIETKPGETTELAATLNRVVDTKGWVSTEYHSHSTPSGDNTSDQLGRVLNLLGEHIEFAPCTEHQRIDSYSPHIKSLNAQNWLATCTGMELTGSPLPLNHQNAFPLIHRPRTQDGGGPRIDPDPVVQIERLAYWDNRSEKVIQTNHPNLVQMAGDADLDGKVDGGFKKMFDFMDVVEVHPPETIFQTPDSLPVKGRRGNVIFNWMQLLNQGYRTVGVVNTDAHYNFHGSGWLRNYVRSSTDKAGEIDTMEMVKNTKAGNVVMTTGPFMEVTLVPVNSGDKFIPGTEARIVSGKFNVLVKIQCSNWLDVNRVQLFLNGKPEKSLNFTRRSHTKMFGNGVVKFEHSIPVEVEKDTHLIVATVGEGLTLGRVMGKQFGKRPPCAVSNPIYVDVDGNGFQASGDKIGAPLLIQK